MALISGSVRAGFAISALLCSIGCCIWCDCWEKGIKSWGRVVAALESPDRVNMVQEGRFDRATNIFSAKNFNGKAQFGIVNEGKLLTMIAVKKIIDSDFQGDADFIQEVEIISTLEEPGSFLLRT